jgi:rhamnose utilization protein RhaD (predicted bifunctional aldolase and dehydrogenase)
MPNPTTYGRFIELSKAIGSDILKTQGAGGNTSFKENGVMWVKASGTWLAHAGDADIMVPVEVSPLLTALRQEDPRAEKSTDFVVSQLNTNSLRPSIETSFHAALNNPVVAHYHCVNTLALAVLERRTEILTDRMARVPDLKWQTIRYRRPGTPLAREIDKVAHLQPDVLILFNHGVIVVGNTVDEVRERIDRVTTALEITPRKTPEPDIAELSTLAQGTDYRAAPDMQSHTVALSPVNLAFALGGSLYPDHVIFLGAEIGVLDAGQSVQELAASFERRGSEAPKLIIVSGKGILLSKDLSPGGEVMARCLAEVVSRIPEGESVAYLTRDEELELSGWEAEQYRQTLDRKAAGR